MVNFRLSIPAGRAGASSQPVRVPQPRSTLGRKGTRVANEDENLASILAKMFPIPHSTATALEKLKKKMDRSYGLNVAIVKWHGNPAIIEFKVKEWRTHWGLGSRKLKTTKIDSSPTYLKGNSRLYYQNGDVILVDKIEWEHVARKAEIANNKRGESLIKFLLFILNDFKRKRYTFGYLIAGIYPNGDGTGKVGMQPVVFSGGVPYPVGEVQRWYIFWGSSNEERSRDLNLQWAHRKTWDTVEIFSKWLTIVAEYGTGGLKKLGTKAALKVLKKPIKDKIKKKFLKQLGEKLPLAGLAFMTTFAKEVKVVFKDSRLETFTSEGTKKELLKKINNQAVLERALGKSIAAFIATLFSEAVGISLDSLLPKDVIEGFGKRLVRWLLAKKAKVIEIFLVGLVDIYTESIDTSTGKFNDEKYRKGTKDIADKQLSIFKAMFEEFVEYIGDALIA